MVITLTGANNYLLQSALTGLAGDFIKEHDELAVEKLDAEECGYDQLVGAVESLPFLAAKKMVIVHDLSANAQAAESIEHIISLAGETTDLIIVESKPDKRSVYYKLLKKLTDFREFKELDEMGLVQWLVKQSAAKSAGISSADARYLVQRTGLNQSKLARELEKLTQYDRQINKASIDLLVRENPSGTIFNLIDSAFSGNLTKSLRIYDEQRQQKVEPQAVHGMLVWQMHAVALAAYAPAEVSAADIAKDSNISPYVIQKSQTIARKMGRQKITEFMRLLREIDYRSKHEAIDYDEALRYAIVTLAS